MKLILVLAWFLVSAGFAPVGPGRAQGARPGGASRSISAAEHRVDLPRPGERAAADWQAGGPRTSGGHAPGTPELLAGASVAVAPLAAAASAATFPESDAHAERPRRLRFPTEANAPPASLS